MVCEGRQGKVNPRVSPRQEVLLMMMEGHSRPDTPDVAVLVDHVVHLDIAVH
jgi:hypothetical protein